MRVAIARAGRVHEVEVSPRRPRVERVITIAEERAIVRDVREAWSELLRATKPTRPRARRARKGR